LTVQVTDRRLDPDERNLQIGDRGVQYLDLCVELALSLGFLRLREGRNA
jgi:hypothetical protein